MVERLSDGTNAKSMREYADKLRDQLGSGLVVLGAKTAEKKCALLVAITSDLEEKIHAGKMVASLAEKVGGRGGGRKDLAQAGGSDPDRLDDALAFSETWVAGQI